MIIVFATVFGCGEKGQRGDSDEHHNEKSEIEAVTEFPFAKERHEKQEEDQGAGDDNRSPDLGSTWKVFQELIEEQKVPFRPRRRIIFRRVRRRTEFSARFQTREPRQNNEEEHRGQHTQAGNRILQDLIRPEFRVRLAQRQFWGEAVPAEKVDMRREQHDNGSGQNTGV